MIDIILQGILPETLTQFFELTTYVVLISLLIGAIGLIGKSVSVAGFGVFTSLVVHGIAVDNTIFNSIIIVSIVGFTVFFAFKMWGLLQGANSGV